MNPGRDLRAEEPGLYAVCTAELAHFKAPKAFIFVDVIARLGNGKPNYRWAAELVAQQAAVDASAELVTPQSREKP